MRTVRHPAGRIGRSIVIAGLLAGCSVARAGEVERIAEVLRLGEGTILADVGAGEGEWSEALAARIGAGGHLFATEVDGDLVAEIRDRLEGADIESFTVLAGDQQRTGLPEACCDAILVRMVYHHFEQPAAMRADLWRSLRPGGRIALIDIVPQTGWRRLEDVPDRGGHGIPPDDLIAEMSAIGFELDQRHDDWNDDPDRYCLVFRKPKS